MPSGEGATARAGDGVAAEAATVREPVKGGQHIEVDGRGIEICSPRKLTSTADRPSQFEALMLDAPRGGTLAVHIPRPGSIGVQDVAEAMAAVEQEHANSSVQAVEFFLPGQGDLRRQVLGYVRPTPANLC